MVETILGGATFAVAAAIFWRMGKMQGQLNGHLANHDKLLEQHENNAVDRARQQREITSEKQWQWHQEQHQRAEAEAVRLEERREDKQES